MSVLTLKRLTPALAPLALLAAPPVARANPPLTLALSQSAPTVSPGGTFQFTGTVSSQYGPLSFGGDSLNVLGVWPSGVTADDTPFLTNAPATLIPGLPYTGGLFDVSVAPGTAAGTYDGTFQVEYDTPSGIPNYATEGFQINVPAVPEASSVVSFGLLLALGGAGTFGASRRRKTRGLPPR